MTIHTTTSPAECWGGGGCFFSCEMEVKNKVVLRYV